MRYSAVTLLVSFAPALPLAAQYERCGAVPGGSSTVQACQAAVDAARAFQPLAGIVVSGGATLLGGAGSLGGAGHFTVATRVNVVGASIPDANSSTANSIKSSYQGPIPAPIVEASAGVWRRIDVLGSALLLPTGIVSGLTTGPGTPHIGSIALGLGLGARVAVLTPAFPAPTISVSVMRRWMPQIGYGFPADTSQPNRYQFSATLRADNYRVHAGWRFALWDAGAGLGLDHYHSRVRASGTDQEIILGGIGSFDTGTFDVATTRAVLFVDGDVHLGDAQLALEAGYQGGKDQTFRTNFSDFDPTAGHLFGGLGLRFGF